MKTVRHAICGPADRKGGDVRYGFGEIAVCWGLCWRLEAGGLRTQIFHVYGTLISKSYLVKGGAFDPPKVRTIATLGHPESMDGESGLLGDGIVEVRSGGSGRDRYLLGERGDGFAYI